MGQPFWLVVAVFTVVLLPTVATGLKVLVTDRATTDREIAAHQHDVEASWVKEAGSTAFFVLIGGLIFVLVAYFLQLFFPDISRFVHPDAVLPEIALYVGGTLFQSIVLACTTVAVLASGLAAHAGVSRLLYVMGRDRVLPERCFGYIHRRWQTPAINVMLVGAVALSAIVFDLELALALVNFGALVAFTFVNLSVVAQFYLREKRRHGWRDHLRYLLLPLCGAATVAVLWLNLERSSLYLGLLWAALGLVWLAVRTSRFRKPLPQFEM